jgi:hypothetical protein
MTRAAPDAASGDSHSSASRGGFVKLSLMHQTAREAAEAVSDDPRFSAYPAAFKKALSVSVKDLVLRTEAALMQGRVEEFHRLYNFRVSLRVRVNSLPDIQCRGSGLSRLLPIHFRPMGPLPPRPPPIINVDQFRRAQFQLPHDTPEELRRLAQDIAPHLIDQPSPPIYRETVACHRPLEFSMPVQKPYESDHNFDLHILCEKRRFQREMSRGLPSLLSETARSGNHEQSTR